MSAVMPSAVSIAPPRGGLLTGQMWSVLFAFVLIVSVGVPFSRCSTSLCPLTTRSTYPLTG